MALMECTRSATAIVWTKGSGLRRSANNTSPANKSVCRAGSFVLRARQEIAYPKVDESLRDSKVPVTE